MNDNYNYDNDNYDYDVEKKEVPWLKLLITIISIVVVVILILLLLRYCGRTSLKDGLLEAGKDYFDENSSLLPEEVGECVTVTVDELVKEGLVKESDYANCDSTTLVKVCLVSKGNYQYTAILSCGDEETSFGPWIDGDVNDLVEDESDVRFMFQGYELNQGTKYFYPADSTTIEDVKEYYLESPEDEYTYNEDEQEGYKWYKTTTGNVYYNGGEYVTSQPSGFPYQGGSKSFTYTSETRPADASYRTIEEITMYKYSVTAEEVYACGANGYSQVILSKTHCLLRTDDFVVYRGVGYSCDGDYSNLSPNPTSCSGSDWSTTACPTNTDHATITCETKKSYTYTDLKYQWYTTTSGRSYYPSGSSTAAGENTYYTSAPADGYIKDESTKALVSKYYRLDETVTEDSFEEWIKVTSGYVTEQNLFEVFNELGYDINSLDDINDNEKIKYDIKMQYRNLNK